MREDDKMNLTRRNLLRSGAALALGASGLGLAGCTTTAAPTQTTTTSALEPVNLVQRSGPDMVQQILSGDLYGAVAWEPYPSDAIVQGQGDIKRLMTSCEIWEHHPCCILAYSQNWYDGLGATRSDEVLRRVVLADLRVNSWIVRTLPADAPEHDQLVQHAVDFTNRSEEVVELALADILFETELDRDGILSYVSDLLRYEYINTDKWDQSGHTSADDYVDFLIKDDYLAWAEQNIDTPSAQIALSETESVNFGYLIEDLHQLAFYVGYTDGYFSDLGIDVQVAEGAPFQNGGFEMINGFKPGNVDVGYLGIAPASIHPINSNDFSTGDTTIHFVAGVNYCGTSIIVQDSINDITDLAGKSVGYPGMGTVQHFLFTRAAEQNNMTITV